MQKILYALIISIIFSSYISYPMQQSMTIKTIPLLAYVVAGCTCGVIISSYILLHPDQCSLLKYSFLNWFQSLYDKIKNLAQTFNTATPSTTIKELQQASCQDPFIKLLQLCSALENKNETDVRRLLASQDIDITRKHIYGDRPLHVACRAGCNQMIIKELLTLNPATLNTRNDKDESAIYLSYVHKHMDIFNFLLNQTDIDLTNLLTLACDRRDMKTVDLLLNHKHIELNDNIPLYKACAKGHSDIVTLLLKYNQNNCMKINDYVPHRYHCDYRRCDSSLQNNHNDGSHYPLLIACYKMYYCPAADRVKFATIIKSLLKDPALDTNIKNKIGMTPLHYATADSETLELLLKKNAQYINKESTHYSDFNKYHKSRPLHCAIIKGNLQSIFLLLEYGADISITNYHQSSPLALVCKKAHKEEIKSTIYTTILKALSLSSTPYTTIFKTLLKSTTHVNAITINASECLHAVTRILRYDPDNGFLVPKMLLEHGADPNQINLAYETSPLLEVAKSKKLSLLNLFIDKYKGNIKQENKYISVLYVAFMSKTIIDPNQINFFKNLKADEKNAFMERELTIIANATPEIIFNADPEMAKHQEIIDDDRIILFNSFIATCLRHGNINLTKKITNNQTLLDISYEQLKRRHDNFYVHSSNNSCLSKAERPWERNCMEDNPDKPCKHACWLYIKYNELIMHAFIQHSDPTVVEQVVDKEIASTYKQEPSRYYDSSLEDKNNQKNYLKKGIQRNKS